MNYYLKLLPLVIATCLVSISQATADDFPDAKDYAYGWKISPSDQADFYEFLIPLEVYESTADHQIRDLGIYNAEGDPIPKVVSLPPEDKSDIEDRLELTILPLYENTPENPQNLKLLVEQENARTMVTLNTQETDDSETAVPGERLISYIVDARDLKHPIDSIELFWPDTLGSFIGRVTFHGSNDLEAWSLVGSGSIASLSEQGAIIEQRKVLLSHTSYDYLRLTWNALPDDWHVLSLDGIRSSKGHDKSRQLLSLGTFKVLDDENGLIFEAPATLLVDQVSLTLPKENSVLRADVYAWNSRNENWRKVHGGLFYNLRGNGQPMVSEPKDISPIRTSNWKVVVENGTDLSDVQLELGWKPDKLVFVAQGNGPYQLVAGRAADSHEDFPQSKLNESAIINLAENSDLVAEAELGPRYEIAGPQQLEMPFRPEWSKWLTWAGLIAGVLLVGFMAVSLLRQMRS
jgi:hypothetical protein